MLRSLLILCSPTSVSDDTGDTDDMKAIIFSVVCPRFIRVRGEPSSFRRFGAGAPRGSTDGTDAKFPNIHVRLLAGWAALDGFRPRLVARKTWCCVKMEDYDVSGGARRIDPENCVS